MRAVSRTGRGRGRGRFACVAVGIVFIQLPLRTCRCGLCGRGLLAVVVAACVIIGLSGVPLRRGLFGRTATIVPFFQTFCENRTGCQRKCGESYYKYRAIHNRSPKLKNTRFTQFHFPLSAREMGDTASVTVLGLSFYENFV